MRLVKLQMSFDKAQRLADFIHEHLYDGSVESEDDYVAIEEALDELVRQLRA